MEQIANRLGSLEKEVYSKSDPVVKKAKKPALKGKTEKVCYSVSYSRDFSKTIYSNSIDEAKTLFDTFVKYRSQVRFSQAVYWTAKPAQSDWVLVKEWSKN